MLYFIETILTTMLPLPRPITDVIEKYNFINNDNIDNYKEIS